MDEQIQNQKQSYDEKKRQRDDAVRHAARRRKLKKILLWSFLVTILGLIVQYSIKSYRESARIKSENEAIAEVQGQHFGSQGRDHISVGAEHPPYNSNPPTSGWHYPEPYKTGVYTAEISDGTLIHNMEHGHIWISYKPDLDPAVVQQLKDVAYRFRSKIIMAPRAANDSLIVLNAWEYQLKLQQFDLNQILGFIKAHRGHGPEDIPDIGF